MTYYEELGLTSAASEEDIRKAHRTLSKLLHPDQQTDPGLRHAAELQMRRINGIVEALLDPGRRAAYDASLAPVNSAPLAPPRVGLLDRLRSETSALGFLTTAAIAVGLTVIAVWFLAGDFVHFRTSAAAPAVKRQDIPENRAPASPIVIPAVPNSHRALGKPVHHSAVPELPSQDGAISAELAAPKPDTQPITAPADPLPQSPPAATSSQPSLEGTWMYVPSALKAEPPKTPLYAPEYIELRIHSTGDKLYGEYSSQYRVPDRAISSRVRFSFHGQPAGQTAFEWRADDGSRGIVDLVLAGEASLRVNWRVTEFGSSIGLGAGTAVLIRRIGP